MARTQAKVFASIWSDPEWLGLTGDAQRLYLLLLSNPKVTLAGCLDLMPGRWAKLCSDWTRAHVDAALDVLLAEGFVVVDEDELLIRSFVVHDIGRGACNKNLVAGMWSAWSGILSPTLRKIAVDNVPEKVWEWADVEVPDEARKLRSEPRFAVGENHGSNHGSQPQSEPSLDLLSRPTPTHHPTKSQSDLPPAAEIAATVVDDQQIRRTAALVGKALAVGADNPAAYAAAATKRILTGDDPTDRDEIRQALVDGRSPEAIAEAWDPGPASDPFGIAAPRQPRQPSATELEAIRQRAHARIADDRARIDETMTTERAPAAAVAEIIGATRAKRRGGAA